MGPAERMKYIGSRCGSGNRLLSLCQELPKGFVFFASKFAMSESHGE